MIAVVIGGAEGAMDEMGAAIDLCGDRPHALITCNDMLVHVARPIVAATLHPYHLQAWLSRRSLLGYEAPSQVWSYTDNDLAVPDGMVTHVMDDPWGGSCGLYAIRVALRGLDFDRIVLCGVPMKMMCGHHIRRAPWTAADGFWNRWSKCAADIAPHVRSMSGRTRERFGAPTQEWIDVPIIEKKLAPPRGMLYSDVNTVNRRQSTSILAPVIQARI
jgi:hypothetical protein